MFSSKLKRPLLALAVTAGLLAVAGPASAQGGEADFTRFGGDVPILSGSFTIDPQYGATRSIQVTARLGLNTLGGNDTLRTPPALIDRTTAQDSFTAVPEFHANDNAFMPNVDDEVLAGVNYEPDYIEGMQ